MCMIRVHVSFACLIPPRHAQEGVKESRTDLYAPKMYANVPWQSPLPLHHRPLRFRRTRVKESPQLDPCKIEAMLSSADMG